MSITQQERNMYVCMYVRHGYKDHLVIDGSTSCVAWAKALTQRVANGHLNFD